MHGRFLLRPSRELNDIATGVVARAARRYGIGVVHFVVLSSHMHLLLVVPDAERLAAFMRFVNGNLAKEAGRLYGWHERFWSRRYRPIVVSDEAEAQVRRLRYLLEQGCKEGLVRSPRQSPGATGIEALLSGRPLDGWWFDRTKELYARRRGESFGRYEHADREELQLTTLPCWSELPATDVRERCAAMVRAIEHETRERLEREGRSPLGVKRILAQDPHARPMRLSRSPAPRFHTASGTVRRRLEIAFRQFCDWYREASAALRAGKANVPFPPGSFPPRMPFARGAPLALVPEPA